MRAIKHEVDIGRDARLSIGGPGAEVSQPAIFVKEMWGRFLIEKLSILDTIAISSLTKRTHVYACMCTYESAPTLDDAVGTELEGRALPGAVTKCV